MTGPDKPRDDGPAGPAGAAPPDGDARYRAVFDAMLQSFAFCELVRDASGHPVDYRVLDVNAAWEREVGMSRDRVRGILRSEMPYPADRQILARFARVVDSGREERLEYFTTGGKWYDVMVSAQGGERFSILADDITDRRVAQERLRTSEQRYQAFMQQSTEGIWRVELEEPLDITLSPAEQVDHMYRHAVLAECNDAMAAMYGYQHADEVLGARLPDLMPRNPANEAYLEAFIRAGYRLRGGESEEVDRDGRPRFFSNNLVGMLEDGRVVRAWGTQSDITQRRLAEQALRDSEARFRVMAEAAQRNETRLQVTMDAVVDYAIITMDPDGVVQGWSRGAERAFGHPAQEIIGQPGALLFTPEDRAMRIPEQELERAVASGRAEDERWHLRQDGSRFYMSGVVRPIHDGDRLAGFVKVARDMTDRKRAEEALLESEARHRALAEDLSRTREALLEADRHKDEFIATLAHELRNPLAPIRSAAQLIAMTEPADPSVRWALDVVTRQTRAMKRLIDDLMDVSRITQNKLQLQPARVTLSTVLRDALDAAQPLIEKQGHRLELHLPGDQVHLDGDPTRLAQVFSNLLENAAKYTEEAGTITVSAEVVDGAVHVHVRDTGIGIPPEHLARIFDLFSQVPSALERSRGGLGIGLSLARHLVELHGGSLAVASGGPGRGSTFTVRLPLAPVAEPSRAPARPAVAYPVLHGMSLLIADDHVDGADALRAVLEAAGGRVRVVYDGNAAVRMTASARPEVALLDIGLPGQSGHEVARAIRAEPWGREMVLVAISGWGSADDLRRSEEAGFDRHLVKPVDPIHLMNVVLDLCRQRGTR